MCGRFDRHRTISSFTKIFGDFLPTDDINLSPSYNISPSNFAAVLCNLNGDLKILSARWGFVPEWARELNKPKPINARAETILHKSMFKESMVRRRCLVLCDGYFEWKVHKDGSKQAYYISQLDGKPFFLGGIWSKNNLSKNSSIQTFCIVTTKANEQCSTIHERMPLMPDKNHFNEWLNLSSLNIDRVLEMLSPTKSKLKLTPVSNFVNNPKNNGEGCIAPLLET